MDKGDAQRRSEKIEPSPTTALTGSSTADNSTLWIDQPKLTHSYQSTTSPYLSRARDDVGSEYPQRDTKGAEIYEKDMKLLPYDYTIRIPQDSPERKSPSIPLTSLLADSSKGMDNEDKATSQKISRVSFEIATTLVSQSPLTLPEPHVQSPNYEIGLPQLSSGQAKDVSHVKWEQIRQLRTDISSTRSQIHQLRASLRQKQQIKSSADDMLFARMRMQILGVTFGDSGLLLPGHKTLDQLLKESQEARDIYGPLEDECNQLEDSLSGQEFKLSQLEEVFYSKNPGGDQVPDSDTENDSADLKNNGGPIMTISRHEDAFEDITDIQYHPLVSQYLSKLGDLDLLHERLDDLIEEKESLEVERQSRLRFGLILDLDDQKWLDGSQHEYDTLLSQTKSLEREAEDLKQDCLALGLVDEDGEPTTFQDQEEGSFKGEEEMHPGSQTSQYVQHPVLLPHPGIDQEDLEKYDPKPDENSNITTNRINEWMLKRLRMSALDVNLLASTFEGSIGKMDNNWEISVLSFWYNDGTVNSTPGLQVHTGSLTTEGGPASGSAPIEPMLNPVYYDFRNHPISPNSDSSAGTEIAIRRGAAPISLGEGPLFWNSD